MVQLFHVFCLDSSTKQDDCPQRCPQRPRGVPYPMSPTTVQEHTDWFGYPSVQQTCKELLLWAGPRVLELSQSTRQTGCPPLRCLHWGVQVHIGGGVETSDWQINIGHCSERDSRQRTGVCPQFTQSPSQADSCPRLVIISADSLLVSTVHTPAMKKFSFISLNTPHLLSPASALCTCGFLCMETTFWKPQFRQNLLLKSSRYAFLKLLVNSTISSIRISTLWGWLMPHEALWSCSYTHLSTYTSQFFIYTQVSMVEAWGPQSWVNTLQEKLKL